MPTEAADTLRSIAKARFLDLLCEGEIGGLVNGARSIYLDETPLQNPDGSSNFPSQPIWSVRNGTNGQDPIPNFDSAENTVGVGVEVRADQPVVRQFTNPALSALRITIALPALVSTDPATGNTGGARVDFRIEVSSAGGAWTNVVPDTITGKSSSTYERSYRIRLQGSAPWTVRVVRVTPDSTSQFLQNKTFWKTVGECVDANLRYPNSALVGIAFDAEAFGSVPSRAYDVRLLKIQVPTNYNPVTRTYTGSWDGNFQIAWSDNPAWALYDLLTNPRYGLGRYLPASQVDRWALYTIGRYCDELVPDGRGGFEPRFTCNMLLNTRAEAYRVISDLASVFRGLVYWASGSVTSIQDSPATPAYLYTPANVIGGLFNYSGSSARARHTVALVTWNDPADFYRQKVEYVEDPDGIARYGVIETQIAALGCASRGQAARVGKWLLLSERVESEVVTFSTGLDGAIARPGQVIKVADPSRAGVRFGGRLQAATTTTATLDAAVTLAAGQAYTFSALRADGTVMEAAVTTPASTTASIAFAALPEAPAVGSIWILSSPSVDAQLFRVVAVVENERHEFEITALAHQPSKFAAVEQGLRLEPRSISVLTPLPDPPSEVKVAESLYAQGGAFLSRLDVSWATQPGAIAYVVTYRRGDGSQSPEFRTRSTSIELDGMQEGPYIIQVYSLNAVQERSRTATEVAYTVLGKTAPPSDVQQFVATRVGQNLNFAWRAVPDVDVVTGGRYEIRQGSVWQTGVIVGTTAGVSLSVASPRGGTYLIKAVDSSGNYSASEAVVIAPDISEINVVVTANEASGTGFSGAKFGTINYSAPGGASWNAQTSWDALSTWDNVAIRPGVTLAGSQTWASLTQPWSRYTEPWLWGDTPITGPYPTWASMTGSWSTLTQPWRSAATISGTYVSKTIDVGFSTQAVISIQPTVELLARAQRAWSAFTQPWAAYSAPTWSWQGLIQAIGAAFEISSSEDNVTWSSWVPFAVGTYRGRYFRLRVTLSTIDADYRPFLSGLRVLVDVPDRVVHLGNVAVPLAGATLSFTPAFVGLQTVQATLQSAANGDRFVVSGKSNTQVTVQIFDSAGSPKAGTIDVDAFGFGERY